MIGAKGGWRCQKMTQSRFVWAHMLSARPLSHLQRIVISQPLMVSSDLKRCHRLCRRRIYWGIFSKRSTQSGILTLIKCITVLWGAKKTDQPWQSGGDDEWVYSAVKVSVQRCLESSSMLSVLLWTSGKLVKNVRLSFTCDPKASEFFSIGCWKWSKWY